jgi:hypothetical protein
MVESVESVEVIEVIEVAHDAPGPDDHDAGPPTAPVAVLDLGFQEQSPAPAPVADESDDAFLAELRKAMADEAPLGPRDDENGPSSGAAFLDDDDRRGWRFGKRR